jgi:hypothetical protein
MRPVKIPGETLPVPGIIQRSTFGPMQRRSNKSTVVFCLTELTREPELARVGRTVATGSAPVLSVPVIDGALPEYAASPGIPVCAEFALHRQQLPINARSTPVLQDGFGSLMTRCVLLLRYSRVKNANIDEYSLRFVTDSADFTVCTENARRNDHAEIPTCTAGILWMLEVLSSVEMGYPSSWHETAHLLTQQRFAVDLMVALTDCRPCQCWYHRC